MLYSLRLLPAQGIGHFIRWGSRHGSLDELVKELLRAFGRAIEIKPLPPQLIVSAALNIIPNQITMQLIILKVLMSLVRQIEGRSTPEQLVPLVDTGGVNLLFYPFTDVRLLGVANLLPARILHSLGQGIGIDLRIDQSGRLDRPFIVTHLAAFPIKTSCELCLGERGSRDTLFD